jgi:hypothetical protein
MATVPEKPKDVRIFTRTVVPDQQFTASRLAIVGKYADSESSRFVSHAALLKSKTEFRDRSSTDVLHCGPPILAGPETQQCRADVVGDLSLSPPEREAMEDWLAGVQKENRTSELKPFQQYRILPHMFWVESEEKRRIRRRFSCAGFVIEAYHSASVQLLDVTSLPAATEDELALAYPQLVELEKKPKKVQERFGFTSREDLGLTGKGPWPIALPGYFFHSTARATDELPRPGPFQPSNVRQANFPAADPVGQK